MDPWEAYKKDKTKGTGGKSGSEGQSRNPWEQYQTEHGSGKITKTPTQPLFGGGYQSFQDREKQAQSLIPGAAAFTLQRQQDWMERSGLPENTVGRSYVDKSNEAQAKLLEITARANREAAANRDAYGTAKTYADNLKVQANLLQNAREAQVRNQLNRRDPAFAMAQDYDRDQLKWYKQAADQAVRLAEAKVKKDQEWISQLDAGDDRYTEARKALQQSQKALREAQARERSVYQAAETRYQAEQFQARTAMENAAREDRLFQTLQAEPEELRKEFEDKNSLIHYMTEEEKSIYRYYWNRDRSAEQYGGSGSLKPDQAQEYKKSLWNELEYRKDTEQAKEWYLPQKGDGILLKGLKLLQYTTDSLFSGGERAMYGIDAALSGSPTPFRTEKDTRLGYAAASAGNGLGGNLYRQWGGAMQSTGQMLPAMLMGNVAAGAMAMMPASVLAAAESATGGLASARNIAKLAQDATFFLSIKGNAYTEALQKGLTPAQAQSYSILSALSEVGLQRAIGGIAQFGGISETQLAAKVNQIDNILLRNAAHYGLNVAGEELEEGLQNFLDPLFVTILTGDKYQAPTGAEMLDTFISTLMMVSVNNVGDTIDYNRQSRIRQNLQQLARQARSQGGDEYLRVAQNIENWIREVDADPENRAYTREDLLGATNMMQIAEDLQAENTAQGPASQPAATNQAGAIQAENNTQGPVSQPAAAPVTAPTETPDVWQNGQGRAQVDPQTAQILRQSAAQEAVSLSDSELQREILDARREASGTDQAAAIARIREQELTRSLEQRRAERGLGVNAPGLGRQGSATTTNDVQQNQKAAATAAAGTGGTYGTAEGFNDGGQRNGRLGAGGEAGGLGGSPEGQVAGGPGQAAEAGTANQGQTVELEAVSARRIGVLGGTDNRTLRVIPPEMESRDMQMIRQEVEARGQKVVFFRGQIERRIKGSGQIRHPNAIYQTAADGSSTYYLRADLRSRNVRQLYEHEAFHDVVRNNKTLWRDMADYLYANYSEEEIDAMVDRYVEAYDGVYGTEETDMDRYLEEIFADAYAGIQRGRISTDAAAKTIREYSQDIEDARRNSQTAQATQQTRGSPDQRFHDGLGVSGPGLGRVTDQRFSFAGERAQNAPQSLDEAQRMLENGEDPETIRRETGWFQGYEGQWRFEIDDSTMEYRRQGDMRFRQDPEYREYLELWDKVVAKLEGTDADMERLRELDKRFSGVSQIAAYKLRDGTATLQDIIRHDDLFEAYPMLRDIRVQFDDLRPGVNASYDEKNNLIKISYALQGSPEETLIHEIQHVIQGIEGFAKGSNQKYWEEKIRDERTAAAAEADEEVRRLFDAMPENVQNRVREYNRANMARDYDRAEAIEEQLYDEGYGQMFSDYMDAVVFRDIEQRRLSSQDIGEQSAERYFNTAGEIEARDAADRRSLTAEQRKNIRPDIDREDVAFANNAGTAFSKGEKADAREALEKLRNSIPMLEDMSPLKSLQGTEFQKTEGVSIIDQVMGEYNKFGAAVTREGFGTVFFTRSKIKSDAIGHGFGRAKAITFAAVPEIIQKGKQIDYQQNWKGRGYDTYIFAGPIELMGARAYVCAIVQKDHQNRFYLHEVLDSRGNLIKIDKETGVIKTGSVEDSGTSAPASLSDKTIPQDEDVVNKEAEEDGLAIRFSAEEDEPDDGLGVSGPGLGRIGKSDSTVERLMGVYEEVVASADENNEYDPTPLMEYFAEPENDLVQRLHDGDKDALKDLKKIAKATVNDDQISAISYAALALHPELIYRNERTSVRRVFDDRIRELMRKKPKVGRAINIENRQYSLDEVKDLFTSLNQNKEIGDLAKKVFNTAAQMKLNISFADEFRDYDLFVGGVSHGTEVIYQRAYFTDEGTTDQKKASILLHEMIHACVSYALDPMSYGTNPSIKQRQDIVDATNAMHNIYSDAKKSGILNGEYGTVNLQEFAAELSNPVFREKLRKVSLWDRIVDAIKQLFGIKPNNALDAASRALEYLLDNPHLEDAEDAHYWQDDNRFWEGMNEDYAYAVETGDVETAERLLDEAAKKRGYHREGDWYVNEDAPVGKRKLAGITRDSWEKPSSMVKGAKERDVVPLSWRFYDEEADERYSAEEDEQDDGLGVSGPGLGRAEQGSRDFDAMAVQKKRDLAEKATVQALRNRIARNEADLQGLEQLRQQGQWNAVMEERARDMRQSLEIDREALAKKQTASGGDLRARIERQESEIRALELARKSGAWNDNAAKRLDELRARNQADKDALREERKQSRQTREQPKVEKQEPRIARQELREGLLDLFHVPAGKNRAEIGKIINKFADDALESGSVSAMDRRDLVRRLYEVGVEFLPAEEYYKNIRDFVKKGRIYVNEEVRQDFGDDWAAFRGRAWGNGIYLTNNQTDAGVDVWNQELAEAFPGSFDAEATDMRQMLEAIVELAEEGKGEKVSLAEMMARNQRQTGESVDQQMDALERKVDQMIDTFAQKARLERTVREQGALRRIRERQDNREKMERARQRKQENELRSQVMKDIQKLNRMRKKTAPEIQAQIRDTIGNIDTVARSISAAGLEDLQALARAYNEAADDPNFLGSPYVEARLSRLQQTQLDDLDISQVTELGRAVCALVKSIQDNNKLLADQRHQDISQAASSMHKEIQASRGSKSALANWTAVEHLSPTRFIQRLGGWLRGGEAERLSRTLEDGQTRKLEYQRQATRIFDTFLQDKKNRKWMQKAHGKQAEWIKVKVPVTDSQGKTSWREIEITPMMRVSLMMHAQNLDNLRHIETGGIRIPEKAAYLKGNIQEALARGERIKMRPETVRAIVKNATAQEKAFAGYLKQYFDVFSKEKINEVSMLLDGFERAGGNNYYHIKTDPDFLAKQPETVQQNLSLESIGSIVNERQHAGNPIVLEDATTALTEHIEQISKYYGFAVPIRDFNAVMNYTFHADGTAFTGSVREGMKQKWGSGAQKYLDRLMADLQQRNSLQDTASSFLSKLRGNLAGASLMFNAAVAMSQAASLPGAAQSVGFDGVLAALGQFANPTRRVDMNLIERYSPLLWYRNQGNSTQELGDYMKEQSFEAKLPWMFGWIQKVDSGTIKLLWYAAEHRVNRDTDLKPGTKAEIDAGTDPYYQEVARVFQRAVYDSQPNYTEMQRPHILRSPSDLTKALTMYKTVPLQYYNMMYEAAGRLMMDGERAKADPSKQNKAALKASRKFFANTFVGVLTANVVYVAMKALVKGLTFRDKKYRDEEGELTPEAAAKQLGLDLIETYAGSLVGGSELWGAAEKLMDALLSGTYSSYGGMEISAISAVEDTMGTVFNLGKALHNQDLHGGLGAIKEAAAQLATNSGLPARNMETYLKAIVKWINPEWAQRYDNVFNETDKADLADERGRYLNAAIRVLMDNRAKDVEDRTVDELQRLWEAGQRGQIPTPVPKSFTRTVNGESETVDLDAKQKQTYRETWNRTVSRALDRLTRDKAYQKASDKDKAAMIQKLYAFAGQAAKKSVLRDYEPDKWVQIGLDAGKMGVRADEYISFYTQLSKITSKDDDGETINGLKNSRGLELLGKMGWSDKQAEAVYLGAMASESLTEKEQIMVKAGMTWKQAAEVLGVVGSNWDHAEQIVKTKTSDKAKLKALSLYLGDADYKAASAGVVFRVDLQLWTAAKKAADAAGNGNGSVNQDEATAYLDSRKDLDLETKAYLWQMLCTSSKYKNNPYSTTMGASCWEYMQTVSKP